MKKPNRGKRGGRRSPTSPRKLVHQKLGKLTKGKAVISTLFKKVKGSPGKLLQTSKGNDTYHKKETARPQSLVQ